MSAALWLVLSRAGLAQTAPGVGYVYPPSAKAGTTIDVTLGGYDWTPDLQFFLHDERINLEILGPPGEIIVAPPPYWFGPKARGNAFPMPREIPARITVPADLPPGPRRWQVANANGASTTGIFYVGTGEQLNESRQRGRPQSIETLPIAVCGRIGRIEEVDRYLVRAEKSGPISCELFARRLGSLLNGMLQVHDASGRLLADVADTEGTDTALTFSAEAGREYAVSVFDLDFRGDRAFVYRLEIRAGPRVVATIPAAGRRGTSGPVEFLGYGISAGTSRLESVTRDVQFPEDPLADEFLYPLETADGRGVSVRIPLSDVPESVAADTSDGRAGPARRNPFAVTSRLDPHDPESRYRFHGRKGECWTISVRGCGSECALDPVVAVLSADGNELARNDDSAGTRNAELEFTVPSDGDYEVVASSLSVGRTSADSIYRIAVELRPPDFRLECPDFFSLPAGAEKAELTVTARRFGGFREAISIALSGLPEGVSAGGDLTIPAGANELKIALSSSADSPSSASLATITGTANVGGAAITRAAGRLVVAQTLRPRAKVTPVDKDGGRTVHRGTTFPAPVIVDRLEDFEGEVVLEMASQQSRHRQGIRGPEIVVPSGVSRIDYPCFMPEWLETSRTSRMILNAVAKVTDARGNSRYSLNRMDGRITMSLEGALLKLSHHAGEIEATPGGSFEIPVSVLRSPKLREPVRVELVVEKEFDGLVTADAVVIPPETDRAVLRLTSRNDPRLEGRIDLTLRATALPQPDLPVIPEAAATVEFAPAK